MVVWQGLLYSLPHIAGISSTDCVKLIHFATERHKSIFGNDEAADIKSVMQTYGKTTE